MKLSLQFIAVALLFLGAQVEAGQKVDANGGAGARYILKSLIKSNSCIAMNGATCRGGGKSKLESNFVDGGHGGDAKSGMSFLSWRQEEVKKELIRNPDLTPEQINAELQELARLEATEKGASKKRKGNRQGEAAVVIQQQESVTRPTKMRRVGDEGESEEGALVVKQEVVEEED